MSRLAENAGLKLASVLLAVLVWFVVAGEKTSEIGLTVPVELQNLPENLEIAGDAAKAVEVRLRATPAIVRQIERQDVSVRIDLKGLDPGEHFFHLTEAAVRRPFGVTVVKLSPASLTLNIERTLARELPIAARVVGVPAAGHEVVEVQSRPASVRVSGPRSRVAALEHVFTEAVPVDGASATVTKAVTIGIGDPLVRIESSPRVEVTVRVRERQAVRELEALAIEVRGAAARLRPSRVLVRVAGPASVLERVSRDSVRPYVDLAGHKGSGTAPVAIELLPGTTGLTVESVSPAAVRFVVKAKGP